MSTHPHPSKIYLHRHPVLKNVGPSEIYPHPPDKNMPPTTSTHPYPPIKMSTYPIYSSLHTHSPIKNVHSPPPTQNIPPPTSTHPHLPIKYPPNLTHPHPPIKTTTLTHPKYTSTYRHPLPPTFLY